MPSAPSPKSLSGAEEHIRWSRGELRLKTGEDVAYNQITGYLEKDIVPKITQPIDRLIAQGVRPVIFNDWWELTGYDSDARLKLTDWIFWVRGKIVGSHVLVRSKIVSMGVSIANLALGGMLTVYTDRQEFTLAYHRALRKSGRVPPSGPVSTASPASSASPASEVDPLRPPRSIR